MFDRKVKSISVCLFSCYFVIRYGHAITQMKTNNAVT